MHLEPFAEGKSFIHSLDPRVKILGLLPFIVTVAVSKNLNTPALALMAGIFLVGLSRLNFSALISRLYVVNLFILLLWLIMPFAVPGRELFSAGPLCATKEGVFYALIITLKANAIFLSTIALIGTVPLFKLTHALHHLGMNEKLSLLFFFCYRYITVLHRDYHALYDAVKARAFTPLNSLRTYKTYGWLIGMLLVKSYEHSQKMYEAMLCRGFCGRFPVLNHFKTEKKDYFFLAAMLSITVFILMFEKSVFTAML
ncbi:MAG: cobalt ECF transporter T component CbiQ [Candidatus Omnitrophica bacterium]|nr:cobalt ECF transporter T component CbiQ [Candidatus Omnitrophota bacterium]